MGDGVGVIFYLTSLETSKLFCNGRMDGRTGSQCPRVNVLGGVNWWKYYHKEEFPRTRCLNENWSVPGGRLCHLHYAEKIRWRKGTEEQKQRLLSSWHQQQPFPNHFPHLIHPGTTYLYIYETSPWIFSICKFLLWECALGWQYGKTTDMMNDGLES